MPNTYDDIPPEMPEPEPEPEPLIRRTNARCWLTRDAEGNIIACSDTATEGAEVWNTPCSWWRSRFQVSAPATRVPIEQGGTLEVVVHCPERASGTIEVLVNDLVIEVALDENGVGTLTLDTSVAGVFDIRAADGTMFPWCGEGVLSVEVYDV